MQNLPVLPVAAGYINPNVLHAIRKGTQMVNNHNSHEDNGSGPHIPNVEDRIAELEAVIDDPEMLKLAAQVEVAIAFVHFDPSTAESQTVEALVHSSDLTKVHRGLYVHILSLKDDRRYSGRIIE